MISAAVGLLAGVALAAGCTGNTGDTGPAGPNGNPGADGSPGATGPTGGKGLPGDAGPSGKPGQTGKPGQPGQPGQAAPPLQGTIGGNVIAAGDSRPLDGASVTLSLGQGATVDLDGGAADAGALPASTLTDANGHFTFLNEPIGSYTLTFARTGFLPKTVSVGNTVAGPTTLAVTLAPDTTPGVDAPTFQVAVSSSNGSADPYTAGFATTVTVSVISVSDANEPSFDASTFSYTWGVTTAPTTANPSGAYAFTALPTPTSTSASFATQTLAAAKGLEMYAYGSPLDGGAPMGYIGRLGVLGINPDETGHYSVSVTIADPDGHTYTLSQPVQSTWQTPNISDVPVGVPVYLQGDSFADPNWLEQSPSFWKWPNTSWSWTVTGVPPGSAVTTAMLADNGTQYPHFVPDTTGAYTLQLTETSPYVVPGNGPGWDAGPGPGGTYGSKTATLTVYAGTWFGIMNNSPQQCTACHNGGVAPDMFTPWQNTAHASALKRKLDGLATSHFNESCLACHATGWTPVATAQTVNNDGFYYVMNTEHNALDGGAPWTFPSPLQVGAYASMVTNYPQLGDLGGIQCENCHGPALGPASLHNDLLDGGVLEDFRTARIDWSEQVCASCHQENTNHYYPSQWGPSKHGNVEVAIQRATVESKSATYGGGADPQSGAQFCARCHSAQGFARYVELLNNGATSRYDFITTDDQKLADGGANAPTTAFLSSLGLNAAQVQSQTCQACHDPHSNGAYGAAGVDCTQQGNNGLPACKQLRIYDSLPGLPDGQGAISGVGAGALCMACHNGRNGEHTDFVNSAPYAETPHDSTATEALFGFNAFFVPRYNPSPHLAVQDTCVGCHLAIPNAAEADAGQTVNHAFSTDLSICKSCHASPAVTGAAIQSVVAADLAGLSTMITSKAISDLSALNATTPLCVRASSISDPLCTGGSCASAQIPTAIPFPLPPSSVLVPAGAIASVSMNGPSTNVTLNLKAAVAFAYYDPQTLAQVNGAYSTKKLTVAISTIQIGGTANGPSCGAASPVYMYPPSSTTAKAIWNYTMLANEGSGGIHNLPWTNAVIGGTETALQTAITNGTY